MANYLHDVKESNIHALDKIEELVNCLKHLSGLICVSNAARFDELDEEMYTNFLNGMLCINHNAINLSGEIRNYLCKTKKLLGNQM